MSLLCVRGGQRACCFFFSFFFWRTSQSFFQAALRDLVMQTRKGNVAGATSGAFSGLPMSPPLFCCCCAALVVLPSSCVSLLRIPKVYSFTLELGAVHASSDKIYKSTAVWSDL